jgi:leucyl-tRNA synthetase
MSAYDFQNIEKKWQKKWTDSGIFQAQSDTPKKKNYSLEMFAYPSGKIHMGHVRNYMIGDVIARSKRRKGFNVLHPMGWDALGLPAENAAIENKSQPYDWTWKNIEAMKGQMNRLGLSYDWSREIATCEPEYYRWNQWFFIRLVEKGLAYRKKGTVNWCPSCQTVLANEQVINGRCWRCDSEVTTEQLDQWYFKITDYAERLLEGLETLKDWPEKVITMQRNWIGKSKGAFVEFGLEKSSSKIRVFTTRIDTIYGATFVVMAPEHPLLDKILSKTNPELKEEAKKLRQEQILQGKKELEKKGFFTGAYAINPFNRERIPVWVANYVLMDYGTGAIMAVPAHDSRDQEFARKYGIHEIPVVQNSDGTVAYDGYGIVFNSGPYTGLTSQVAQEKMTEHAEKDGFGEAATTYKIKDWGVSRQRFWGTPIPMIHCPNDGIVSVPDDQLPVILPRHITITGEKGSPLSHVPEYVNVKCPKCGGPAKRDTDTMDTFVDSGWYFYRYCSPHDQSAMFDKNQVQYWMPIDLYIGGVEHAILHLIYCRFLSYVFHDMGMIDFQEPIQRLFTQGMVIKDGAKMSKSKGNVVSPDDMIARYGADTARLFSLFAAPPEKELEWNDQAVEGTFRFLNRVWKLVTQFTDIQPSTEKLDWTTATEPQKALIRKMHQTIRKVTGEIDERMHQNTAISSIMELVNTTTDFANAKYEGPGLGQTLRQALETILHLLNPFAPHITEELWSLMGHPNMLSQEPWPEFDETLAREEEVTVVVQVNGKLRASMTVPRGAEQQQILEMASGDEKVRKFIENKPIAKVVFVPDKLVNIVVKEN